MSIASATRACVRVLDRLACSDESIQEWAEDQTARLNLWAASLGVFADGRRSVEYRLRLNSDVCDVLVQILVALKDNLETHEVLKSPPVDDDGDDDGGDATEGEAAGEETAGFAPKSPASESSTSTSTPPSDSDNPPSDCEKSETSLDQELRQDAEDVITRLVYLSRVLRKPGFQHHEGRAEHFEPKDADGRSYVDEFSSFMRFQCDRHLANKTGFQAADYLKEKLYRTILRRWRLLCYRGHHADAMAAAEALSTPSTALVARETEAVASEVPPATKETRTASPRSAPTVASEGPKQPSAATNLPTDFTPSDPQPSGTSSIATSITRVAAGKLDFPQDPKVQHGARELVCPYCRLPRPVKELSGTSWQSHVLHDLCPYICIFEDCPTPDALYRTSDIWYHHIKTEHAQFTWKCTECKTQQQTFGDPVDFAGHWRSSHAGTLSDEEIALVIRFGRFREPTQISHCAFCGWQPAGAEEEAEYQEKMRNHLADDHMRTLALLSLPWTAAAQTSASSAGSSFRGDESIDFRKEVMDSPTLVNLDDASPDPTAASLAEIRRAAHLQHQTGLFYLESWLDGSSFLGERDSRPPESNVDQSLERPVAQPAPESATTIPKLAMQLIKDDRPNPLVGYHQDQVRAIAFSPDGTLVVSGSDDGTLILWEAATGRAIRCMQGLEHDVEAVAFSPDGSLIASAAGGAPGRAPVRLWSAATGEEVHASSTLKSGYDRHLAVAFSQDGSFAASASKQGNISLWDQSTGAVRTWRIEVHFLLEAAAFSNGCDRVAVGSDDGTVEVWETAPERRLWRRRGFNTPLWGRHGFGTPRAIPAVAFSPNGKMVASGGQDGIVMLWDALTGARPGVFYCDSVAVWAVAFSPDSRIMASASRCSITLWDVVEKKEVGSLREDEARKVLALAFSPAGKILASGSDRGSVTLWDWEAAAGLQEEKATDTDKTTAVSM